MHAFRLEWKSAEMNEIFEKSQLKESTILEVDILSSGYLKNEGGQFTFVPFEANLQLAPITAFCIYDFDGDGELEALAAAEE